MGLKVKSFHSMVVRLNERLSIERYYTFIQGKSTLWLTTMNHSLVTIVRVTKCIWMDLLWMKLLYPMMARVLWMFIQVLMVLAPQRHRDKILVVIMLTAMNWLQIFKKERLGRSNLFSHAWPHITLPIFLFSKPTVPNPFTSLHAYVTIFHTHLSYYSSFTLPIYATWIYIHSISPPSY